MGDRHAATLGDVVARLVWMMIGPILLAIFCYLIVKNGNGWLTAVDLGYLGVLAAILLARCFEAWNGHPQTANGEPATSEQIRRYLIAVALIGLLVWVGANVFGNHW